MPTQRVPIPLLKGIDESIDDRMLPGEVLAKATNGYFKRTGEVVKRHGFTQLTSTIVGTTDDIGVQGPVKGLLAINNETAPRGELVALGYRTLYAYVPETDAWFDRGPIAPSTGHQQLIYHGEPDFRCPDADESNGIVVYAATRVSLRRTDTTNAENTGSPTNAVRIYGKSVDGEDVFELQELLIGSRPYATRVCKKDTGHVIFAVTDLVAPADLRRLTYDTSTPEVVPMGIANVTADLAVDQEHVRMFDATGLRTGDYATAYIDSAQTSIELERWDTSDVSQATATITGDTSYERVAICDGGGDNIFVAYCRDGAESGDIVIEGRDRATLANSWGPIPIYTLQSGEACENIGVAEGVDHTGTRRVAVACGIIDVGVATNVKRSDMIYQSFRGSDGIIILPLAGEGRVYNCLPLTKPWWKEGRCYVACAAHGSNDVPGSVTANQLNSQGLYSNCVADLALEDDSATSARLAGAFDIGLAAPRNIEVKTGSTNNAFYPGKFEDQVRFMAQYMSFFNFRAPGQFNEAPSFGAAEVQLDYDEAPTATAVTRGAALIGGAFITWYAGEETMEWGFLFPPVLADLDQIDGVGGIEYLTGSQAYNYQQVWEQQHRGWLHRSLPTYVQTFTPTVNADAELALVSLPLSHRDRIDMNAVVYRNDTPNGIVDPQRTQLPGMTNQNTRTSHLLDSYFDTSSSTQLLEPIYTAGGEVENVMPDGARIVTVVGDRVWTGDHIRRSRVGFSKRFSQGAATEDSIVPETNEGFSLLTPDGSRVQGVAELDGRVVAFSQEATYAIVGSGPDNTGAGLDYNITKLSKKGCVDPRSVVRYTLDEKGGVMFQADAGIHEVTRSLRVKFTGDPVRDSTAAYPVITSAVNVESENQIRFTCWNGDKVNPDSIILVYDYRIDAWTRWEPKNGSGQTMHITGGAVLDDVYYIVEANGCVYFYDTTTWLDGGCDFVPLTVETGWLRVNDIMGFQRIRYGQALTERREASAITVDLFYDYSETARDSLPLTVARQDEIVTSPTTNMPINVHGNKCETVKMRISDAADAVTAPVTGEGYVVSGFAVELRKKAGRGKIAEAR